MLLLLGVVGRERKRKKDVRSVTDSRRILFLSLSLSTPFSLFLLSSFSSSPYLERLPFEARHQLRHGVRVPGGLALGLDVRDGCQGRGGDERSRGGRRRSSRGSGRRRRRGRGCRRNDSSFGGKEQLRRGNSGGLLRGGGGCRVRGGHRSLTNFGEEGETGEIGGGKGRLFGKSQKGLLFFF